MCISISDAVSIGGSATNGANLSNLMLCLFYSCLVFPGYCLLLDDSDDDDEDGDDDDDDVLTSHFLRSLHVRNCI